MIETIVDEATISDVLDAGRDAMVRLGMTLVSFHITMPHKSQVGKNSYVAEIGVPAKWMERYCDAEFRAHDPIPDFIMRHGECLPVKDVISQLGKLTEKQQAYIDDLLAQGPIHAWGIPTYGPFDFDSYCAVSLDREMTLKDDGPLIRKCIAVAEFCNRRIGQLVVRKEDLSLHFSRREMEVLKWMGRSKSNNDIATIIGVSSTTVDTYVRRVFEKFGVNDRISAVVKGVRLGYIRY